jgi:PEP-CTERM motif-containing protein
MLGSLDTHRATVRQRERKHEIQDEGKSMRRGIAIAVISVAVIFVMHAPASASAIYDNLASTTYTPVSGVAVSGSLSVPGPFTRSASFVAGSTQNLGDVLLPIWNVASFPANFNLTLTNSSNTVLESWNDLLAFPYDVPPPIPVMTIDSVLHPLLTMGSTYTLTASADNTRTYDAWSTTDTLGKQQLGFRVDGPTPTPEPGTLMLLSLGVVIMVAGRAFRRRLTPAA